MRSSCLRPTLQRACLRERVISLGPREDPAETFDAPLPGAAHLTVHRSAGQGIREGWPPHLPPPHPPTRLPSGEGHLTWSSGGPCGSVRCPSPGRGAFDGAPFSRTGDPRRSATALAPAPPSSAPAFGRGSSHLVLGTTLRKRSMPLSRARRI